MATNKPKCIFCKIAQGQDEKTTLLYQDEGIAVFRDIKPASKHHYLVIPVRHIRDCKQLTKEDAQLVEQMVIIGKQVLTEQGGDPAEARLGFHWPPFHAVKHFHLHVICPEADIGFLGRQIYRPNSWWFVTVDWVLDKLKSLPEGEKLGK